MHIQVHDGKAFCMVAKDGATGIECFYADVFQADSRESRIVRVFPECHVCESLGMGGALTEAAASVYFSMPQFYRNEFMRCMFSGVEAKYSLCRIPIMSCDFSLGEHEVISSIEGELDFSGENLTIDFAKEAVAAGFNGGFILSPWSPPAFMKTNGSRRHGGRLKRELEDMWAYVFAACVRNVVEHGLNVEYVTIQNEPNASQEWDSCVMTAQDEGRFARYFLREALDSVGLHDVKILCWDHNKERLVDRARESMGGTFGEAVDGVGFHWYSGDHFDSVSIVRDMFPDKVLIATEACVSKHSERRSELRMAERYAHDVIGDFSHGANGWVDWNVLLDGEGGPSYVRNPCSSHMQFADGSLRKTLSWDYYCVLSNVFERGCHVVRTSSFSSDLEVASVVCGNVKKTVVLNRKPWPISFIICDGASMVHLEAAPSSLMSVSWV